MIAGMGHVQQSKGANGLADIIKRRVSAFESKEFEINFIFLDSSEGSGQYTLARSKKIWRESIRQSCKVIRVLRKLSQWVIDGKTISPTPQYGHKSKQIHSQSDEAYQ